MTWLLLIIFILFLFGAFGSEKSKFRKGNRSNSYKDSLNKRRETLKAKFPNRQTNSSKPIHERNEDIIMHCLSEFRPGGYYSLENSVRDCIADIAALEGNYGQFPDKAYLSTWKSNYANEEYLKLCSDLETRFSKRKQQLEKEKADQEDQKEEQDYQKFKRTHKKLLEQFYEIAARKGGLKDEYGDPRLDLVNKEIDKVAKKISDKDPKYSLGRNFSSSISISNLFKPRVILFVERTLSEYQKAPTYINYSDNTKFSSMTGSDFESYLINFLIDNNFQNVRGTPSTGDQGADILAKFKGRSLVIQAKCYKGKVGNKAVQEVVSALQYYGGDQAWVITNSSFTQSAKDLAQKTNVKLIDGFDLSNFEQIIKDILTLC